MITRLFNFFLIAVCLSACVNKTEHVSQWRGENRDGIYNETGLLKAWPENGPELLWSFEGLGAGHGAVSFSNNKIFVLGMPDTTGVLFAFSFNGDLLWKKEYGTEWYTNFNGSRSTPTVVGDLIYFQSGQGVVYCYHAETGDKVWSVEILKDFQAKNIVWGMTESLLVDGEQVFCTPGGTDHNVVSLNRFTGETIWSGKAMGEPSAYCSPLLIKHDGTRLFVTMTIGSIIALDADNGEMYWSIPQNQSHKIHANTPVYWNGHIICSSDYGQTDNGLVSILLSNKGKSASVAWRNQKFTNLMGGIVLINGIIVGSEYRKKGWSVLSAETGELLHKTEDMGNGAVVWADELYYCYTEEGTISLVDAGVNYFNVISTFTVPLGTDQHWAHPVIYNKKLFVRHGNALMVYDIEDKEA